MAEPIYVVITANQETIEGEPPTSAAAPPHGIECVGFSQQAKVARSETGATGRRRYEPIVFRKRIDRATPLLAKALAENQSVTAVFHFYRPSPSGDGTIQEFLQVEVGQAGLVSIREWVEDELDPALAGRPPLEEIGITFHTIQWTYLDGDVTYQDTWGATQ